MGVSDWYADGPLPNCIYCIGIAKCQLFLVVIPPADGWWRGVKIVIIGGTLI